MARRGDRDRETERERQRQKQRDRETEKERGRKKIIHFGTIGWLIGSLFSAKGSQTLSVRRERDKEIEKRQTDSQKEKERD